MGMVVGVSVVVGMDVIVVVLAVTVVVVIVGMVVIVLMHAVPVLVVAVVVVLLRGHLVALKEANAEQERQVDLSFDRAQDPRIGFDLPQLLLHGSEALLADQVALVEQEDVAIDHLGSGYFPIEDLVAEVLGINQGDDRVEPGLIP